MGGDRDTMTKQLSLAMDTAHNKKAPEIAPNHQISSIPTFQSIQAEIAESLVVDKEQDYLLDILLASTLSIELERPLFMMVQAASSSGKSAYLILFDKCAHFHKLHSLTPRTLFSGHSDAEGGYIPAVMKKKGILCIPDFTTVLSECKSNRNEIFSQLRIAYDGEGGRATGVDVKNIQDRQWRGKLACICAVTGKIELFKSKASDLGERFLYYRHTAVELNAEEMLAWSKKQAALNVRKIQSDIKKLLSQGKKALKDVELDDDINLYIYSSADYIAKLRAVVDRDNYTRQIEYIHPPEKPFRLQNQLRGLYQCLLAIHDAESNRPRLALNAVVYSCIPELRLNIVELLSNQPMLTTAEISTEIGLPETTVRTRLEDLSAQQILEVSHGGRHNASTWNISPSFKKLYEIVRPS